MQNLALIASNNQKHVAMQYSIFLFCRQKVKFFLYITKAPHHKDVLGERRYTFTHSLNSAIDGGEWSASRPGRFTPRERATDTHFIGGWVGPTTGLDMVWRRKIPSLRRESNPNHGFAQPVASPYTD
jgi:hypothetical protein